jgi:hypothetical protein
MAIIAPLPDGTRECVGKLKPIGLASGWPTGGTRSTERNWVVVQTDSLCCCRSASDTDATPPALDGVKSPARLATTSGGVVIVRARPKWRARQKFLLGPRAALSGT